ncbi:hypothetical protein T265_08559 [Opisthorchis viverrini]|uniref:Uncharacterized protein n=1 Tax=Opisthorchis viverrini TaxID=6198 RepID=A0A074Z8M7_OPIVI|nr:hypothetical protein T265_08559 [Opisthorchis viverrini]KER23566.1 hypothetical protein T265_08559 [Opisthorchis viverrini]
MNETTASTDNISLLSKITTTGIYANRGLIALQVQVDKSRCESGCSHTSSLISVSEAPRPSTWAFLAGNLILFEHKSGHFGKNFLDLYELFLIVVDFATLAQNGDPPLYKPVVAVPLTVPKIDEYYRKTNKYRVHARICTADELEFSASPLWCGFTRIIALGHEDDFLNKSDVNVNSTFPANPKTDIKKLSSGFQTSVALPDREVLTSGWSIDRQN